MDENSRSVGVLETNDICDRLEDISDSELSEAPFKMSPQSRDFSPNRLMSTIYRKPPQAYRKPDLLLIKNK
ncbi:hypothetical protein KM043_010783 [Ampulex compressa]|nr:hypothetical protein KM043_010783 [Ampulex compressa]